MLTFEHQSCEFFEPEARADGVFESSPEALRGDMQVFARLRGLTALATEIGAVKHYLDDVAPHLAERELSMDRTTLAAQAVAEFRRLLQDASAQAKEEHPDKKTVRLNLR